MIQLSWVGVCSNHSVMAEFLLEVSLLSLFICIVLQNELASIVI